MPAPTRRFPDLQTTIIAALGTKFGSGHIDTETPPDLAGKVPFCRVRSRGGPRDQLNGFGVFDVDIFDTLYSAVEPLANDVCEYLCGPPPPTVLLDRIQCDNMPQELPWGDGTIRRMGSTYTAVYRRRLV